MTLLGLQDTMHRTTTTYHCFVPLQHPNTTCHYNTPIKLTATPHQYNLPLHHTTLSLIPPPFPLLTLFPYSLVSLLTCFHRGSNPVVAPPNADIAPPPVVCPQNAPPPPPTTTRVYPKTVHTFSTSAVVHITQGYRVMLQQTTTPHQSITTSLAPQSRYIHCDVLFTRSRST